MNMQQKGRASSLPGFLPSCCHAEPHSNTLLPPPPGAAAGVLAPSPRQEGRITAGFWKHRQSSVCKSTGSDSASESDATAEVGSSASRASLLDDTIPEG